MQTGTGRARTSRVPPSLVFLSTLAFAGWFSVGCGSGESGSAAIPLTPASQSSSDEAESAAAARESGPAQGDVAAIQVFDDPASQIATNADLTAYLLPGMSGPGVDCAQDGFDPAVILEMPLAEASNTVTGIILECVDREDVGSIVAMYAVGFRDEGPAQYPDLATCASAALGSDSTKVLRDGLESIYLARLDLPSPPTSPDIAKALLAEATDCLDPQPSTAFSTPESATTPAPTTTAPTTTAPSTTPAPTTPANTRSINWNQLAQGDCLAKFPEGEVTKVTVTSCDIPHVTEVVGASFLTSDEAEDGCHNLFKNYTGQEIESTPWVLDVLEAASQGASARVICLASSADGEPTTGSLRKT